MEIWFRCTQAVGRSAGTSPCICSSRGLCVRHRLLDLMLVHLQITY
ncbi:hypothetical protein KP509_25G044400 [Ceratopteris richardii]|uniref:Uncharacterized protein n=1 Tax=Ceratopteris richardii TaxID=49495 RepID=A0A8T2RPN7_CERRI|nr:hypothetical protein KP509_25G044400 [Ceratopteris richardii]